MKQNQDLFQSFVEELRDVLSCEHQIIESLPIFIKLASSKDLKEVLSSHLHETEQQAHRIQKIFSLLNISPKEKMCEGMRGILSEGSRIVRDQAKGPILDAIIISAAQKVEHYEIASYGALRSFANHLGLDKKVITLLQENLHEESAADKKLTKIAEGGFFSEGINAEAVEVSKP
ncbi:MAG: ferritin-like domain-containing protein [Parachlamydiaceae bacterium]